MKNSSAIFLGVFLIFIMVISIVIAADPWRIEKIVKEFSDNFINSTSDNSSNKKYIDNKNSNVPEIHMSKLDIEKEMILNAMDNKIK